MLILITVKGDSSSEIRQYSEDARAKETLPFSQDVQLALVLVSVAAIVGDSVKAIETLMAIRVQHSRHNNSSCDYRSLSTVPVLGVPLELTWRLNITRAWPTWILILSTNLAYG